MGAWPDLTEYHEAVQHPQKAFADRGLKGVTLELDRFGMPKPATGGNAVVYKAHQPGGFLSLKKTWAIRCFLRPISDHAERYEAISKHLRRVHLPYDVNFQFLKQGIQIRSNWFPIVKMQWAKGDLLHSYIEKHLHEPALLAALRSKWVMLVRHLEAAQVAHGDLQHGNILVRDNGSIQLVDYDGMWVPALQGRHATETGHRAYQHPERSGKDYGQEIDRFSALVVYLSLAALERDATLWERFHTGDNLIFVREDFVQAGRSPIWQQLSRIGSGVDQLAAALATMVHEHPMKASNLDSVFRNLGSFKMPTSIPASPPAPPKRVAPKPPRAPTPAVPKPAVPSWMKKSGYRQSDE